MKYDIVVIGAGHNGLAAAIQLAKQGKQVLVLEKEPRPGGAAKSGEVAAPGFIHDLFSMNISLFLKSRFYKENQHELAANGFKPVYSSHPYASVFPDGKALTIDTDPEMTHQSLSSYSTADADAWKEFDALYDQVAPYLYKLMQRELPSLRAGLIVFRALLDLKIKTALKVSSQLAKSPRQFVDSWFENDKVKSLVVPWGYQMDYAPDISGGAAFPLIEAIGHYREGIPFALGGIQTMIQAMVTMLEARGGELQTNTWVNEVHVEDGEAQGVFLNDGTYIEAGDVIATATPTQIADHLIDAKYLPASFESKAQNYQYGPKTMMIHLALNEPLRWTAGEDIAQSAYVHVAPYVEDVARTHTQALNDVLPDSPLLIVGQPSAVDVSRAPEGKAAVWIMVRSLPAHPKYDALNEIEPGPWSSIKEQYADRVIDKLAEYAPDMKNTIEGRHVFSPEDLPKEDPNLVEGDHMAGSHQLFQHFLFRPIVGYSRYQTPIRHFYMIGASTWPGGGLNAGSGYLLAEKLKSRSFFKFSPL
ncbi:phytoene desaturase family protein [Marinococcus luteus]|uniref:phytoene desaturase family protein n=1 Tax=Marinococcus luteus TaxID=1122204 RepID=UPI002ACC66AF|nr:NAD(P)/FAD-dependent oxidoreductase [Marinococcus luteus]MDZ5782389.1 NAD(P)/FAD-dependent oxidoreductase [Marinococcus luteus]